MIKKTILAMSFATAVVSASTLDVGMIGHYTFEGDANDIGNSGNTLQIYGSSQFISSGHNGGQSLRTNGDQSLYYNGGGYLVASFLQNRPMSSNGLTISFWTINESTGGIHPLENYLSLNTTGLSPGSIHLINGVSGTPQDSISGATLSYQNLGWAGVGGGATYPNGLTSWKMHTVSIVESSVSYYLDGQLVINVPTDVNLSSWELVTFGRKYWDSGSSARMTVEWDDMRIYDRALSSTEVSNLYTTESVPEPSSLALLALGGVMVALGRRRTKETHIFNII